jgi:hypothetical protein
LIQYQPPKIEDLIVPNDIVGKQPSGDRYFDSFATVMPLTRITIWSTYAIKVEVVGGHARTFGTPSGDGVTIQLGAGKKCSEVSLWSSGDNFNGIRIVTGDKSFKAGPCTGTEHSMMLGSGLLIGFKVGGEFNGQKDINITQLEPLFLKPVKSIVCEIKDIALPNGRDGIKPVALDEADFSYDKPTGTESWNFGKTVTKTTSSSWTQSAEMSFGMSVSVSAGIPEVVDASTEAHWNITTTQSHEATETSDKMLSWGVSGTLGPGDKVHCTALTQEGKVSVDYNSEVTVTLESGYKFTFKEPGHFKRVDYSKATVITT